MNGSIQDSPLDCDRGDLSYDDSHHKASNHVKAVNDALTSIESQPGEQHIKLGWRSWLVVFVTCFG